VKNTLASLNLHDEKLYVWLTCSLPTFDLFVCGILLYPCHKNQAYCYRI